MADQPRLKLDGTPWKTREKDERTPEQLATDLASAEARLSSAIESQDFGAISRAGHDREVLVAKLNRGNGGGSMDTLQPMYEAVHEAMDKVAAGKAVQAIVAAGVTRISLHFTSNGNATSGVTNPGVAIEGAPLVNVYTGRRGQGTAIVDPATPKTTNS